MAAVSKIKTFKARLLAWYAANKRDLPFRGERDPYRIWVSEVLLQQTQMSRGVEYYKRFVERFPTIDSLSGATWEEFLPYFRGLGFYNRGRNMLNAAKFVVQEYGGVFPDDFDGLMKIPGVGAYTANAILSFAYGHPVLTRDTNVNRILARFFHGGGGTTLSSQEEAELTGLAQTIERSLSAGGSADLNQAMMDLGSAVCLSRGPRCVECPLRDSCSYGRKVLSGEVSFERRGPRRETYDSKYPIALIHYEGRVLLPRGHLPGGPLEKGDERAFLKQLAEEQFGLEISVRPPFLTWVANGVRYSAHRCRILAGPIPTAWPSEAPGGFTLPQAIFDRL